MGAPNFYKAYQPFGVSVLLQDFGFQGIYDLIRHHTSL